VGPLAPKGLRSISSSCIPTVLLSRRGRGSIVPVTASTASFRFLFGSDRSAADRGWFVEDAAIAIG
jgi:hypothetical protein